MYLLGNILFCCVVLCCTVLYCIVLSDTVFYFTLFYILLDNFCYALLGERLRTLFTTCNIYIYIYMRICKFSKCVILCTVRTKQKEAIGSKI